MDSREDRRHDQTYSAATHGRLPLRYRQRAIVLAAAKDKPFGWPRKSAAILDCHSTRWRSRTAVGAEEWLRRGQTKEWVRKQFSCQDFVITIRKGRHQFSWHKKQEHLRIFPSDTVVVLISAQPILHKMDNSR